MITHEDTAVNTPPVPDKVHDLSQPSATNVLATTDDTMLIHQNTTVDAKTTSQSTPIRAVLKCSEHSLAQAKTLGQSGTKRKAETSDNKPTKRCQSKKTLLSESYSTQRRKALTTKNGRHRRS